MFLEKDKFLMYNGIEKNKVKHIRIMNYSLPIYNTLDNYVWSWMNLDLVNELHFSHFFFFFTLKVFVSLKIEEIYTMDNKIG